MSSSRYTSYRLACIKNFSWTFSIHVIESRLIQWGLGGNKNKLESNLLLRLPQICYSWEAITKSIAWTAPSGHSDSNVAGKPSHDSQGYFACH